MELPQKGFYVHYKHDPAGVPHNYMYEVIGVGRNTEERTLVVLYRPLYQSDWLSPADYNARPLEMFVESVEKDGALIPRFRFVDDPALIVELESVRKKLYGI